MFKSTYKNVLTHLHEKWTADSVERRTKGLRRLEKAVLAVLGNFLRKMADSENTQSKSAKRMFSTYIDAEYTTFIEKFEFHKMGVNIWLVMADF